MNTKTIVLLSAIVLVSFPSLAAWIPSDVNRLQALPNGDITFWLSTNSEGCGSHSTPFRIQLNTYGVNESGRDSMKSILLTAIAADKSLNVSVRDEQCFVDSITLIQ